MVSKRKPPVPPKRTAKPAPKSTAKFAVPKKKEKKPMSHEHEKHHETRREAVKETAKEVQTAEHTSEEPAAAPEAIAPVAAPDPMSVKAVTITQKGEMGARIGRPDELVQGSTPSGTGGGMVQHAMKPEQLEDEGETVKMNFPSQVNLTLDDRRLVSFPAGHHNVPKALANHPYLKASGVEVVKDPPARELPPTPEGKEPPRRR